MIVDWARARGISLKIDAVDASASILEVAKKLSTAYPEITFIQADALRFTDAHTYDLVHCSLALHHFSNDDAARLLRNMRELSHDKVLASDLERSALTRLCVWMLTAFIFREPMTKYDGRLSVRRAFSFGEFSQLARAAGWEHFGHHRFFPTRQAMWLCLREVAPVVAIPNSALDYAT
jgi:2-polyprenyl-3-methyl-5-hydroxy-6-metoxy-1,4-benzoquinol methylase